MMIPLSKMKVKFPSIVKRQASTQTVHLKNPSDIRLPSYSAFYTETMYKVDTKNYENLFANKYKMELERLKAENKKFIKDIEKFSIQKSKLEMRLKELTIAYEILWNEEKKKNKMQSLQKVKKKRATIMSQVVYGEVSDNALTQYSDENLENSAVLIKKDKNEILYSNIQLNKHKYDQILESDLENMIDEELRTVVKLKDLSITELKKEKETLISNNQFLKKNYDELIKTKMINKELRSENQTLLMEVDGLKLINEQVSEELAEVQKEFQQFQQQIQRKKQIDERQNKDLKSFSENLDIEEKKIKEFLKEADNTEEGQQGRQTQATNIYKQTIEYLLFMVKKLEKKYLDEFKKWDMERCELERELKIQQVEIQRLKWKKTSNQQQVRQKKVLNRALSKNK